MPTWRPARSAPAGDIRKARVQVLWSVVVLLLIALVGGLVVGVILAFGLNTVVEGVKSLRRGTARR